MSNDGISPTLLQGIQVLELASVLAGPSVGMFLAELGATVLKVEHKAKGGDVTRNWYADGEDRAQLSSYFTTANWGKKSIDVDLSTQSGRDLVQKHLEQTDILLVSYKPGDAEKFGLDYPALKDKFPRLIFAEIQAYPEPNKRVGYDVVLQAESGWMHLNGSKTVPQKLPVAIVDLMAAHYLKQGVLAALLQRHQTNLGCKVAINLWDAAVCSLSNRANTFLSTGAGGEPTGSVHPSIAPYGEVVTTLDGDLFTLAIGSDAQFGRLLEFLNLEQRPEWESNALRVHDRSNLDKALTGAFAKVQSQALLHFIEDSNMPIGKVQKMSAETLAKSGLFFQVGQDTGVTQIPFVKRRLVPSSPQQLDEI